MSANGKRVAPNALRIGWAQADITPPGPIILVGQFYARVSEGIADPVTTTVLVLDSGDDHAVLVSCDLVSIPLDLTTEVRKRLAGIAGLDPMKVSLNAIHTHTAPGLRCNSTRDYGVELEVCAPAQVAAHISERIAGAIRQAWKTRAPGQVAFGLGHAVIGRNRRMVKLDGTSVMYGNTNDPAFSHIEGYEDHSVGVLATRDMEGRLTGLVVNVPCPSQVSEHEFRVSADYWCDTRQELRRRLGENLYVLPQCSAAADQSPHLMYDKTPEKRMLELAGITPRQRIARDIAHAVEGVLGILGDRTDAAAPLHHHVEILPLPMNRMTEEMVRAANQQADEHKRQYEEEMRKLRDNPTLKDNPRWYVAPSDAYRKMLWNLGVADRFEQQKTQTEFACELHVIRLGGVAIATCPFEYYLDYGIYIKARSAALQTFLVQLAGPGTYLPSLRSTQGGGYGSLPASIVVGPDGGRILAERTVDVIAQLWAES